MSLYYSVYCAWLLGIEKILNTQTNIDINIRVFLNATEPLLGLVKARDYVKFDDFKIVTTIKLPYEIAFWYGNKQKRCDGSKYIIMILIGT